MKRAIACLVVFLVTSCTAAGGETKTLAVRVLEAVDRPVGLVHLPRCSDAVPLLTLAGAGPWVQVHGQAADPAVVASLRRAVSTQGLLNRRIAVDQGDLSRLLPVARSCDLVFLTDLRQEELTAALAAEIKRVLHPWYGVAILGDASGSLDAAKLRTWAKGISEDVVSLGGDGTLVSVHAGPAANADDWTHWWHGLDNNAVSADGVYGLPETLQWSGKPFFSTRIELPIIAGGRLFMLWNGHAMDTSPGEPLLAGLEGDGPLLTAQAVGSGVHLWTRRLSPAAWLQASRSTMVADGKELLVADGGKLLVLDQATGQQLRSVQSDCEEIRWLAVAGDRVLVLGGAATGNHGHRSMLAVVPFRSGGRLVTGLDRQSLAERWRIERDAGPDAFDPRSPAVADRRLFLCTERGDAEAFELREGKSLWRHQAGFERWQPQPYEWDRSSRHPVTGYALQGIYLVSGTEQDRAVALAQDDGRVLWSKDTPKHHQIMPLAFDDLLWDGTKGFDPLSGELVQQLGQVDRGGCSRLTACPLGVIGTSGVTWNLQADREHKTLSAKSACGAGQLVANGLIWKFPSPCSNCTEWRGFLVRGPAGPSQPPMDRLVTSPDYAAPADTDASGWLTYRGRNDRSSSTAAVVPTTAGIAWTAAPVQPASPVSRTGVVLFDAELAPTPPIIAGRTVIVAGGDGSVAALDRESGRRLWRAHTGGRITSSPAVWRDRVFVGSTDGCLYALALTDGREQWRLRVAPQAGRIMVYGQLGDRWPVLGSPLVLGDRVVATAGLLDAIDGVWAACADAATGELRWQRNDWTAADVDGMVSGAGQLAAAGHELLYHGGESPVVRLDANSGECRPGFVMPTEVETQKMGPWNVEAAYRTAKGQDVGAINSGWAVLGGRRLLTDQAESGTWRLNLAFMSLDAPETNRTPLIQAEDAAQMPAWDDTDVLFSLESKRLQVACLVPQTALASMLRDEAQRRETREGVRMDLPGFLHRVSLRDACPSTWEHPLPYGSSIVGSGLTGNAALLLVRTRDGKGILHALARHDGSELWQAALPGTPIHDGLAVAVDGAILVQLLDGSLVALHGSKGGGNAGVQPDGAKRL